LVRLGPVWGEDDKFLRLKENFESPEVSKRGREQKQRSRRIREKGDHKGTTVVTPGAAQKEK
jgi:hypothetical protein